MPVSRARAGFIGLLGLALAACALWGWWSSTGPQAEPVATVAGMDGKRTPFAASLRDTQPDGDLRSMQGGSASASTAPLAYGELRRLFDYYLSTVGEQSIDAITQQIRSELARRLDPAQAQKAQRLLALYIEFKRELVRLESQPQLAGNGVQAVRGRFLAMQDVRSRYFSATESEGMFGFEDAYDMDAISRLEISQDPKLSAQDKQQQYAALDAAMPAALREQRDANSVVYRVEQQAQELRAKGASEDDIYRMRAQAFDPEAAARLADVDREEAAWKARITQYLEERNKLMQSLSSASERQTAVAQLQQSLFTAQERPRLAAYE